jgi:hypothetical protein
MNENYIFKKIVDWSALNMGVNIPVSLQGSFYDSLNISLPKGKTKRICLLLEGVEYHVLLSNIGFDENKYQGHKELLQLKWSAKNALSKKLQSIFRSSYQYLLEKKMLLQKKRQQIAMPEGQQEYLVFYSSKAFPDSLVLECLTHAEVVAGKRSVQGLEELYVEQVLQAKDNAELILRLQLVKLRKLDQTIGDGLKRFYAYKCQICGLPIGELYGATIAHTHHIEYFCKSLNNDAANIMIVCPNHHGIIHAVNPRFDWEGRRFVYPNGFQEGLRINKHL